jgi:2-polyprenyl-6-methoxyphenol hydroxylase-like FAD-dependent oxidoreductase
MSRKMIVAGGGIGGMTAALALHRAGNDVTIFERAPAFAEVGAGMSLWPNATHVLQSLGVLEQVLARGEPVTQFNLQRPDGKTISTIPMGGFSTPAVCVHRADLHQALHQSLHSIRLEAGQTIRSFTQSAGGVTARFASGLEARADGLIGADGINSAIRSQIHGSARPIYRGYCIWRGIAPDIGVTVRGHISETWGAGQRFGILPMGQGRICWYATRNGPPSQPDAPEGRKSEIRELFHDWHHAIPALIEATKPADIMKNDAHDRKSLRKWGEGCVTLLGDAAHPITPNVGQGACMAIEDAACLAKFLARTTDVVTAFRSYEAVRKPRTAFVARQSRRIGAIGQWENPWIVKGRNFITRLVLSYSTDAQLNTVYAYKA